MAESESTESVSSPQILTQEQADTLLRICADRRRGYLPSLSDVDFLLVLIDGLLRQMQ